jgi:Ca-activated chloride channel family protein
MTLLPVMSVGALVLAAVVALGLVWWPQPGAQPGLATRARRTVLVAAILVASVRPGLPGAEVRASATDLNVFFVIDTTTSSMAEDFGSDPRMAGMRADITALSGRMAGARFALITFDHTAVLRMPLTSDGAAVASAAETLLPETSAWSRGSSVTVAGPLLGKTLARVAQTHPERARLVFYLGDGEQTSGKAPDALGVDPALVNGGAVLGYGTSTGGQMHETGVPGSRADAGWLLDPNTGKPALSVIDETQLGSIAAQLGVPYLHRSPGDSIDAVLDQVDLSGLDRVSVGEDGPLSGSREEFYWIALLVVAGLVAWEVGVALSRLWGLRHPRRSRGSVADRDVDRGRGEAAEGGIPAGRAGLDGRVPS